MKTLKEKLVEKYGKLANNEENWRVSSCYHPDGIFYDKFEMATELGMLDSLDLTDFTQEQDH